MFGKKKKQIEKLIAQNEKLHKMCQDEKDRCSAYKEIAKVHSAYIALLLLKLGATAEETAIAISDAEVKKAIAEMHTRGINQGGEWKLFVLAGKKD